MASERLILQIPSALVSDKNLNPLARSLYLTISQNSPCSILKLVRESTLSRECVRKHLKSLVQGGWVIVRGRRNLREVIATSPEAVQLVMVQRIRELRPMMAHAGQGVTNLWLDVLIDTDEYVCNARPWILQNPATGEYLEYDRFFHKHKVAFEYNGPQHYQTTERFPDQAELIKTRLHDEMKVRLSREHDIVLVMIHEEDLTLAGMLARIPSELPRASVIPGSTYICALEEISGEYIASCRKARAREQSRRSASGS